MKLRLIEGGAGSGKSRLCLAEMAENLREQPLGAPLLLLVPEQATFESERALVNYPGVGASLRAQAVGFSGLYRWLAAEKSFPALPWLDEQGRAMLLAACVQQNLEKLQLLKPAARNVGFIDLLARTLVEFEQYNILPEDLRQAGKNLQADLGGQNGENGENEDLLTGKLADLALLYQEYLRLIEGGFRDRGVMMRELAEAAAEAEILNGAELWLDGFLDMNPSQMAVMRQIMPKAKAVNLCLCLPDAGAERIFGGQRRLRHQFVQLARDLGAEIEIVRLTANHRPKNEELAAVEVCFAAGRFAEKTPAKPQHIHLASAGGVREEAELAARTVVRLCKEKNYKFREIAVITRNLGDYRLALENAFRDFGVPYFLDMGRDVSQHPLVRLPAEVLAVLTDWQNGNSGTASVLAYLKCGLAPIAAEEADVLENYALRVGIKGGMWRQAGSWRRGRADELAYVNKLGQNALRPLLDLANNLQGAEKMRDYAEGLLQFMTALQVDKQMAEWAARAVQQGYLTAAEAHRQIWPKVELLLRQMADFLGDMPADAHRFAEIWREGAARLSLSSIPPAANQVNVAEVSRSRLPEVKAAIVLGLAEGSMPAVAEESGLLGSADRERLAVLGVELAAGGRERQFLEDYLLYVALTRSSEELYLSFPQAAADGAAKNPSPVVADLQRIFPALQAEKAEKLAVPYLLGGDRALLAALAEHLTALRDGEQVAAEDDAFWRLTCRELNEQKRLQAGLAVLQSGLQYQVDKTPLDKRRLLGLYPNRGYTSVSRMEQFNSCPCKYYAGYGLGLEPREEFKLQMMDVGSLYHYILAEVMSKLVAADCDWAALNEEEIKPLIAKALQEFAADGLADILADSGKNSYAAQKITQVVTRTLLDMAANLAAGSFRPLGLELSFGEDKGKDEGEKSLRPLVITLSDGQKVKLRGQIDRVDVARGTGGDYLRIIDYKMKDKTLRLADIYYGLNWQLPLYLQALLQNAEDEGHKAMPAGMFYVPVQEIIKSVKSGEDEGAAVKLQGLAILDMEALVLAERDLDAGQHAKTMQVHIKKDNTFGSTTLGLTPTEYKFMQNCLLAEAGEKLDAIMQGELSQRPVAPGGRPICEYCDYYALCAVDLAVEPQICPLEKLSKDEVLHRLAMKYSEQAAALFAGRNDGEEGEYGLDG